MKLYLVVDDYEGFEPGDYELRVVGVFDSREKAEEALKNHMIFDPEDKEHIVVDRNDKNHYSWDDESGDYYIITRELNKEPE